MKIKEKILILLMMIISCSLYGCNTSEHVDNASIEEVYEEPIEEVYEEPIEEVYEESIEEIDDENYIDNYENSEGCHSIYEGTVTRSDRNPDGSYTREYVDAYVKRENAGFRVGVLDASEDKMYNGELCYFVMGSSIETNASGFTHPIEFYIGSKTLKIYSYSEVTGW